MRTRSEARRAVRALVAVAVLSAGLLEPAATSAQTAATVVTQFSGRATPDLFSILDGITVTVIAHTPDGIGGAILRMEMTGDNGITLRTPADFLPGEPFPLDIVPGLPAVLHGIDLSSYFDPGQLEFSGMTQADYFESGLPPGTYRVCFQAICPPEFCGMPIEWSAPPPAGCSNAIVIREVEPPTLLSPPCGKTLTAQPLQSVVFSWSPPPGSDPVTTTYRLRLVEMVEPDQSPQEAIEAATTPVFFEQEVAGATSLWYGPSLPLLEAGRTFAWRVTAENAELLVPFENGGHSEACSFTYGEGTPFLFPPLVFDPPPPPPSDGPPALVGDIGGWTQTPWAWVKGKLRFKFAGGGSGGGASAGSGGALLGNLTPVIPGATHYDKGSASSTGTQPLGGFPVKLVVTYRLLDTSMMIGPQAGGAEVVLNKERMVRQGYDAAGLEQAFPDLDRVVATTTTASDGSFTFQFIHSLELGLVAENFNASPPWDPGPDWAGGPVLSSIGAKKVTRTLRVVVDSPYYCSPDNDILVEPWQTKDVGTVVSLVKSYRFHVGIEATSFAQNQAATGPMAGVVVSVLRKDGKPAQVPAGEGDPAVHANLTIGSHTFRIVAKDTTNAQGKAEFTNLVAPASLNDAYWYYSETLKTAGVYNYKPYLRYDSSPLAGIHNRYIRWDRELLPEPEQSSKSYLSPDHPRIVARTMDKAHDVAVPGATVVLKSRYQGTSGGGWLPWPQEKTTYDFNGTNSQGYAWFEGLDVEEDAGGGLVGPDRFLSAFKTGYESWLTHLGILARGKQEIREINLQPDGLVLAAVRDKETKQPLPSKGNFQGGVSVSTVPWNLFGGNAQVLLLSVASGQNQTLEIVPFDSDYQPETFTIDVKPKGELTILGPFDLTRKRHRIAVRVVRNPPPGTILPALPLKDATVRLLGMTGKTDSNGIATFTFDNNSNVFTARIEPPPAVDAVARSYTIINLPTVDQHTYTAKLAPATRIHGQVTVGDSIPVAGARVFVDNGSGPNVIPIETHTAGDGTFLLRNIPLDPPKPTVFAAKSSATTTYVGASRQVALPTQEPVALNLTVYTDMDITRLLGFPIEITALQETASGVTIDGSFTQLPPGPDIAPKASGVTMPFGGVALEPGVAKNAQGVPYAVPKQGSVATMTPSLPVDVFSSFHGELKPATGSFLAVTDAGGGKGVVRGRVTLQNDSFSFSPNEAAFPVLHLTPFGESTPTVTALRADPSAPPADRFGVGTSGNAFAYKLYGFDAASTPAAVTLAGDSLVIPTVLHADAGKDGPLPLSVDAGDVVIRPGAVGPVGDAGALDVTLEAWKITAAGWELGKATNGIHFATAQLATGAVNVPLQGLHILPTDLVVDKADLTALTLSGVAPLTVTTDLAHFGYDPQVGADQAGHWKLSLMPQGNAPAAALKGLPGMKASAQLALEKVSLLSNGEQLLTFPPDAAPVPFYDVFALKPGMLAAFDGFFQLSGTVDLGIPRLASSYQAILTFSRPGAAIEMKLDAIPFQFTAPGKVQFLAAQHPDAQRLDASGFHAAGKIVSSEGVELKTVLHRTTQQTNIVVEPAGQTLPIGGSATWLSSVAGEMHVEPAIHDWRKFVFSGDMEGVNGMEGDTRKTFTIHGDITADGQKATVKNLPTPFGNMAMTYDYPNGRMTGDLVIDQSYGPVTLHGVANLLVDGSGWYILSGGDATIPGFGNLQAGILIGDYAVMPATVSQTLMQFAYDKSVPPGFQNGISGFFVTGRKNLPQFSVPDGGFSLGVISAHFGGDTGLDGRLWMDFAGPGTELGIGGMAFVTAHFIGSSITCTSVSGSLAAELGAKGIINPGTGQYDLHGCGSLTVGGSVEQCVPTPSLDGISCELCEGIGVSQSLAMNLSMGTGGVNASLGLGSCSGNAPPLESGW